MNRPPYLRPVPSADPEQAGPSAALNLHQHDSAPSDETVTPADMAELRRTGIALECAASTLNAVAQRVAAKQADIADFTIAEGEYEYAREDFREQLGHVTGQSSAWLERVLAL